MHHRAAIHAVADAVPAAAIHAMIAAVHDWATDCVTCCHDSALADAETDCSVDAVVIPVAEQVAMQALLVLDADATSSVRLSITRKKIWSKYCGRFQ